MAPTVGLLARTYYSWKALRLPWRKRFFIGYDLQGNTYWEFKLTSSETRLRRIVHYPRSTHLSQVQVSPLWHQWLRHMRAQPPSLEEQQGDLLRRDRTKILAAEADARWEAKPRVMTAGDSPAALGGSAGAEPDMKTDKGTQQQQQQQQQKATIDQGTTTAEGNDAWSRAKKAQGVGEKWQPAAWKPSPKR
ncbi:hypothetical protein E4U43_007748 [Claviceps pusilla]|uniref:NADH dehydrogenase [ubiquinone] 1 alpha subcomplex subunit n=1 Tax=Claviceps pusilla TaxID=123648 RepID=A0A9P7NE91_9HYPO|nr:hypothetical protein E4U43_007748 [Claviceps pusilla]